jgi:hypothetical protein
VVLRSFDEAERKLVAYLAALVAALKNSDSIDGTLKKVAMRAAFRGFFLYLSGWTDIRAANCKASLLRLEWCCFYKSDGLWTRCCDQSRDASFWTNEANGAGRLRHGVALCRLSQTRGSLCRVGK